MDSFYNSVDLKCPFCHNPLSGSNSGEKICPKCQAEFEIDGRGECVFVNLENLRMPINGPSAGSVDWSKALGGIGVGIVERKYL